MNQNALLALAASAGIAVGAAVLVRSLQRFEQRSSHRKSRYRCSDQGRPYTLSRSR